MGRYNNTTKRGEERLFSPDWPPPHLVFPCYLFLPVALTALSVQTTFFTEQIRRVLKLGFPMKYTHYYSSVV